MPGEGGIRLWDLAAGREWPTPPKAELPCAFSPDGRILAYVEKCFNGIGIGPVRIGLWDVAAGKTVKTLPGPVSGFWYNELFFAPDGRYVVSYSTESGRRRHVQCWDVASGREVLRTAVYRAFFPRSGPWFVAIDEPSSPDGLTRIYRLDYGGGREQGRTQVLLDVDLLEGGFPNLKVSSDGQYLTTRVWADNSLLLWVHEKVLTLPGNWVYRTRINLLDGATGREEVTLPTEFDGTEGIGLERVIFAPDQSLLALITNDQIAVWDVPAQKPLLGFLTGAALLALPLAVLARWRMRRLRRTAA
jgi:WD40 repeat protein